MSKKKGYQPGKVMIDDRLGRVVVVRDNGAGCIDVRAANGRYYRISGLPIYPQQAAA